MLTEVAEHTHTHTPKHVITKPTQSGMTARQDISLGKQTDEIRS